MIMAFGMLVEKDLQTTKEVLSGVYHNFASRIMGTSAFFN